MRRAFVESLTAAAEKDPRVVFLTGDLGFGVFDDFAARFGPRYVNVGIAEAQMICAAAGLALEGCRPLAYSISSFLTGRAFEQIRISVAYQKLPVILVGAGGGYCYAHAGVTHHAADDFGLMSLLPGMTVVAPGDPNEVRALLPQMLGLPGPSYMRIGKFGEPCYGAPSPVVLGRARTLLDGEKVALLCTGEMAAPALTAARTLAEEGLRPVVCQHHTIKPLDTAALDALAERVHTMLVLEEAAPLGGLYHGVLSWLSGARRRPTLLRLGPPDDWMLGSMRRETLRARFRFDEAAAVEACRSIMR